MGFPESDLPHIITYLSRPWIDALAGDLMKLAPRMVMGTSGARKAKDSWVERMATPSLNSTNRKA